MKTLIVYNQNHDTETLSYQIGWVEAFKKKNPFECSFLNLHNFFPSYRKIPKLHELKNLIFNKYECIILLHSTFSNACLVPNYLQKILKHKKAYKVFFVGNEYKHMQDKINFTKNLEINLFLTQSHLKEVIDLYKNELKIDTQYMSNVGIDENIFFPKVPYREREPIIGYRSGHDQLYFGNKERENLYNFLKKYSVTNKKYVFDISINKEDRFGYIGWADFINKCKCMFAPNTGFDYFYLNDDLRNLVNDSNLKNFDEVYKKFFLNRKRGTKFRCLTGKTVEPAACKTPLIQVEGDYDKFKPDIHYISLNNDYSNINECLEKLDDKNYLTKIIENSFKLVQTEYLYSKHLDKLYTMIKKKI